MSWRIAASLVAAVVVFASAHAQDDFPITGNYTRDVVCKGNGSDDPDALVRISRDQIESKMGICRILSRKRDGKKFLVHVECKVPGLDQPYLGDITFTVRDERTVDFEDQDHTSDATLHKCTG